MKWLGYGWESEPGAGMSIHVNGTHICNVDTLHALERLGLVEQLVIRGHKAIGKWKATKASQELAGRLCLYARL